MKQEQEQKKKTGLAVREFKTVAHFNTEESGILTKAGYLDYPGHELDGKQVFKTTMTPKINPNPSGHCDWGTPEHSYSVEDGTKDPPLFTSVELLMSHYKLKLVTR